MLAAVVVATLICEGAGYFLLRMAGEERWPAIFHSISAFCNAGFSLNSDSLQGAGSTVTLHLADASVNPLEMTTLQSLFDFLIML